jgi:hypothetical protein
MPDGICPFAEWRPTGNYGYGQGTHGQNRPLFFVDHIMAGWKRTLDDAGWREPNGVGVHFGIGKDGSISQYTNILDASWGNGVSGSKERYDRGNRHLAELERQGSWVPVTYVGTRAYALLIGGVNAANSHSISTEHEGQPGDAWTPAMLAANIRVKQWCIAELARVGRPMTVDNDVLAGHFQIDGVHRANCPGPNWPRATILAAIQQEEDDMASKEYEELKAQLARYKAENVRFILFEGRSEVMAVNGITLEHVGDPEKVLGQSDWSEILVVKRGSPEWTAFSKFRAVYPAVPGELLK